MTRSKLMSVVARKSHLTKRVATDAVDAFLDELVRSLEKGEKVVLSGIGTFYISRVKDKSVVPFGDYSKRQTIKAHNTVVFKVGRPLKRSVW